MFFLQIRMVELFLFVFSVKNFSKFKRDNIFFFKTR